MKRSSPVSAGRAVHPHRGSSRAKSRARLASGAAVKRYDEAYFERWYRDPRTAVIQRGTLARRVQLAIAAAEFLLERPIRTVLDVGCGEGAWRALLKHARPGVRYTGVDSSEYAVRRYGRRRNIRLGRLGDLGLLGLRGPFDLVVCCDVLHYVSTEEALRGLRAMARLMRGFAMIEVYTSEDETVGDDEGYQRRSAASYRRLFREAGLVWVGLHGFVTRQFAEKLTSFERE